jgi:hypothetical protein
MGRSLPQWWHVAHHEHLAPPCVRTAKAVPSARQGGIMRMTLGGNATVNSSLVTHRHDA